MMFHLTDSLVDWTNKEAQEMLIQFQQTLKKHIEQDTEEKQKFVSELEGGQKLHKLGFEFLKDAMCHGESLKDVSNIQDGHQNGRQNCNH